MSYSVSLIYLDAFLLMRQLLFVRIWIRASAQEGEGRPCEIHFAYKICKNEWLKTFNKNKSECFLHF